MDISDRTLKDPQFGLDGGLLWTDGVEEIYKTCNENGKGAVALMSSTEGPQTVLLLGWQLATEHRTWVIRMSVMVGARDPVEAMPYACDLQYAGEIRGQKMYPRLPFDCRFVGILRGIDDVNPTVDKHLDAAEREAEDIYQTVVAEMRATSGARRQAMLFPKPWWRFW